VCSAILAHPMSPMTALLWQCASTLGPASTIALARTDTLEPA
jgi:hypothetical protein